jgi:hypothetical protein
MVDCFLIFTRYGVVFDLVQCLIQRALLYATSDIRECYVLVKKALYRPGVKMVVLILHSQGGIEGGMILDWLLDEVPQRPSSNSGNLYLWLSSKSL